VFYASLTDQPYSEPGLAGKVDARARLGSGGKERRIR
jgi:hypothetical protein